MAVSLGSRVSQYINVAAHFQDKPRAHYLAEAGIIFAKGVLANDKNSVDSLNEPWSSGRYSDEEKSMFKGAKLKKGSFDVSITDEERKININTASGEVFERLLRKTTKAETDEAHTIASSALDWRDKDDAAREGGAENTYYHILKRSYDCKNGKFEVPEELLLVKGMTKDIFFTIKGRITIYGDGKVNINTATAESLYALGMSDAMADKIIQFRKGLDSAEGTKDDYVFKNPSTILDEIKAGVMLNPEESLKMEQIVADGLLSVNSKNFSIISEGRIGRRSEKVACITDKGGNLISWRE